MTEETRPGIRETVYKQPGGREPAPATEMSGVEALNVQAETVIMRRSGSQLVSAERVTMEQSGAKSIDAKSVQMDESGALTVSSERAVMQGSAALQVAAHDVRMVRSRAVLVAAGQAHLEGSRVLLLAGHADGDVRATLTPQTATILGLALGAGLALAGTLIRSLRGRGG